MKSKRGDVVLLDYPYSDASGSKVRPALVVQNDRNNARLLNTIVALISKNTQHAGEPTHLMINIGAQEGQGTGLHRTSVVVCSNLFTVHEKHVIQKIGQFSPELLQAVDPCLKAALGLS